MDNFGLKYPIRGIGDKGEFSELTFDEIQELKTPFFSMAMELYHNFKLFGLPHGNGWLNERDLTLDILSILEDETNAFDAWEMKKDS